MKSKERIMDIDPYIFISYSHSDEETVLPYINALSGVYNTWFDRMIVPKTIWDNEIAQKIESCTIMICFLSKAYCNSDFCMKELRYAKDQNREILPVYLERVNLPPGLKMHFTDEQYIELPKYSGINQFMSIVSSCEQMLPCRSTRNKMTDTHKGQESAAIRRVKRNTSVKSSKPRKAKKKKTNSVILLYLICFITAVFMVAPIVIVLISPPANPGNNDVAEQDQEAFIVNTNKVTQEELELYLGVEDRKCLMFVDCNFLLPEAYEFKFPEHLEILSFQNCTGLTNIDHISELAQLRILTIQNCDITDGFLPEVLPVTLEEVTLSENERLSSLSPLRNCERLSKLDVSYTAVSNFSDVPKESLCYLNISATNTTDLSQFSACTKLTTLYGSLLSIANLDQIADLEHLVEIDFGGCGITTLNKDFMSLRLETLYLANNELTTLDAFKNCTILKKVNVSGNHLTEIDVLMKSKKTLQYLDISDNPLSSLQVKGLIESLSIIDTLCLDHIPLSGDPSNNESDLAFLSSLTEMKNLSVSGCEIDDLLGLEKMVDLEYLNASNNRLTSVKGLSPAITNPMKLTCLLNNNPITDWSALPDGNYYALVLYCPESPNIVLPPKVSSEVMYISSNTAPELLAQNCVNTKYLCVVDCPLDRRVAFEDSVPQTSVEFMDEDHFYQWLNGI